MRNWMKFDTRNKKPNLYSVLVLSIAVAALEAVLLCGKLQSGILISCAVLDFYFAAVLVLLARAFFGQIQYNPYSYNTIYYAGFFLFLLSVLLTFIGITVQQISSPGEYQTVRILSTLLNSAKNYMLISLPFVLAFSSALCISNIELIRHERRRLANVMGIILSVLMLAGEAFLFRYDYYVTGSLEQIRRHALFANLFAAGYLYYECMIIGAIVANMIAVLYEPDPDKDFMIILGCRPRQDGTPTPLLKGRIDRAIAFYRKQKAETGKDLVFIPSGGKGPDEPMAESACMKRYLMDQGIPEDLIVEENKSTNTFENMKYSKEKILSINPNGKIVFSTTNYHVFRSGLYARRHKMRAVGIGAKTKWYFWPNAAVREFVGLLTEHRGKQILIIGGMVVIYVGLTLLVYR